MLIDINTYTGHWPFRQLNHNSCNARMQLMQQAGIDISVISNLNGIFYKNTQSANEELYSEIQQNRKYESHLFPFAVINPIYAGWKDDLKKCTIKMGFKGVRLHPHYHRYDLTNPHCVELVKTVRDLGLPIAISMRIVDKRVSSWMDINEEWSLKEMLPLMKIVPDAKYMILNAVNGLQLSDAETEFISNIEFIMDTSGRSIYNLGQLLSTYGKEKFAFGSHSPILDSITGLLRIESLRHDEASDSVKELLRSGNAQIFFNL